MARLPTVDVLNLGCEARSGAVLGEHLDRLHQNFISVNHDYSVVWVLFFDYLPGLV